MIITVITIQGWAQGKKKKKPDVKIVGDYLLKKIEYFPPWKCKKNNLNSGKNLRSPISDNHTTAVALLPLLLLQYYHNHYRLLSILQAYIKLIVPKIPYTLYCLYHD